MSCSNNQNEKKDLDKKYLDKKTLEQKYLEQTFLSTPIHEYIKLVALVFVCQHMGIMSSRPKYDHINHMVAPNMGISVLIIFAFCYINSNYKLEFSLLCTISVFAIYYIINILNKKS
jgi:hypothetical protein